MAETVHSHAGESDSADGAVLHGEADHALGRKFYFMTWLWLLVLTVIEVTAVALETQRPVLVPALLIMTVMKAALIIANFMHVRFEHLNLIYVVVTPFILAVILFIGVAPDFSLLKP